MKHLITVATVATALAVALSTPQASAAPSRDASALAAAAPCTTKWKVIGKVVAVRRPAWNDGPVAKPNSPEDHYLHRGDVVTSCIVAIARTGQGPAYSECGRTGNIWRVVRGGQVPQTCLKRRL
ncbi:hypothetical protein ACFV2H_46875 [Streptomyces sp. NPDC059629]|uniref:hypothetical protein n=1 Tax=Streptomyces sp. NPDC059629 TaxID=3346889 RepID=UPI0036C711C4